MILQHAKAFNLSHRDTITASYRGDFTRPKAGFHWGCCKNNSLFYHSGRTATQRLIFMPWA